MVTFLRRSTVAANLLRATAEQLNLPSWSPVIDVATRWNSTLDMVEKYLVLHPAICVVVTNQQVRGQFATLTDDEIRVIEQLVHVSKHILK